MSSIGAETAPVARLFEVGVRRQRRLQLGQHVAALGAAPLLAVFDATVANGVPTSDRSRAVLRRALAGEDGGA